MTVLCLVEHDGNEPIDASLRALSFARILAESSGDPLVAALVGDVSATSLETLGTFGVGEAYSIESDELDSYAPVGWAKAIMELASSPATTAVVAAGTDRGNEVMAHVGALTGLAVAANCLRATRSDDMTVSLSRQRWAGSLIEDAVLDTPLALLTVAFDGVAADAGWPGRASSGPQDPSPLARARTTSAVKVSRMDSAELRHLAGRSPRRDRRRTRGRQRGGLSGLWRSSPACSGRPWVSPGLSRAPAGARTASR